jgi:L-alanine-DL-glutamate epimerase-like enolase superfamily enzyme
LAALVESGGNLDALPTYQRAARAALDAAQHDLAAQKTGQPVWKMLGLRREGPPTSYTISLDDPDAMAWAAESEAGRFRVLKLKLGGGDGLDVERVRAVRNAVAVPLRVDVNEGWHPDEALDLITQLAGLGVELVEQPLPAGDPAGEKLRARSPLPIFVDEDCRTAKDVAACARRAHGVNIKLSKCGGIGEAMKCVGAARACGLRTMIGCMIESTLGIAAAAHISSCFDYADIDSNLLLDGDPFTGVDLVDGVQRPSDAPGLGVKP